ncbi:MAG: formylglycine-generating enzyme family protein [Bacteroidetes bacterium]|nr:formylglycine-generating enzyme family protein [Bacteroidota bacterium]
MKNLWMIWCIAFLFSCQQKEEKQWMPNKNEEKKEKLISNKKMILIEGGQYTPFYGRKDTLVTVEPFYMDDTPVTNAEFLEFVKKNPQWSKSKVKAIYSDSTYLKEWPSDFELPKKYKPNSPVCYVSWFAAKAYAESVGKRLPTQDEWEFVGQADDKAKDATKKPSYSSDIIDLYNIKDKQYAEIGKSNPNVYGIYNMFDLVWEWSEDFNSTLTTGDSRKSQFDDKQLSCAGSAISANDIYNYAAFMRFAFRTSVKANYTISNLGFRCAKDAEPKDGNIKK